MDAGQAANANTTFADGGPHLPARGSRAAVIFGNDAVVAARPCTPAQLTHASRAAGFDIVVPPSCGDELVAGAYLERLGGLTVPVAVACDCVRVQSLLRTLSDPARPPVIATASPPVAAARYLRLVYGDSILVTYVGDCPAANDASINARFSPAGFFASLEREGIVLTSQPNDLSDPEAERWRRYRSLPGGLPTRRWLARAPVERVLREVNAADVEARHWSRTTRTNVLLDLCEAASCPCGGNRAAIEEYEPDRSLAPVVVAPAGLDLSEPPPAPPPPVGPAPRAEAIDPTALGTTVAVVTAPLPRFDRPPTMPERQRRSATAPRDTPAQRTALSARPAVRRNRAALLATIPAVVLLAVGALGAAVYAFTSPARARTSTATGESSASSGRSAATPSAPGDSVLRDSIARDSIARDSIVRDSIARDSTSSGTARPVNPRRPTRGRAPEVVPGWLPQGAKTWTPGDTNRKAKPDSAPQTGVRPDSAPPA